MRIAIFWNYLWRYRLSFYQKLAETPGIELTVFHGGLLPQSSRGEPECADSWHFRSICIKTIEKPLLGAVLFFQTGMWKHLLKMRFDVIVCEGNFGILTNFVVWFFAKLTGARLLLWVAGWQRNQIRGYAAQLRKVFIRLVARMPDGYLCYSSSAKEFLLKFGVDPSLCTVVQNTIDTEEVAENFEEYRRQGEDEKKRLGLIKKRIILSVGHLRASKGMDVLIDAFKLIRASEDDCCLIIIGDGPERNRLSRKCDLESIPDVVFLGAIFDDIAKYFAMSDMFALPGDGGLAINQAMAFGLPVICTEADGTEKDLILDGRTGFFFKKDDSRSLQEKLLHLLSSDETRQQMGKAAKDHVYRTASMSEMQKSFIGALIRHRNRD